MNHFAFSKLSVIQQEFQNHYFNQDSDDDFSGDGPEILPHLKILDSTEIKNKLNHSENMPFMLRAFDHYFPDVHMLDNYGCWCYFYDVIPFSHDRRGRGQPVDDFDKLCKKLHDAYDCAVIDNDENGLEKCVPWEVDYSTIGLFGSIAFGSLEEGCEISNDGDACKTHACLIEANFVSEVIDLVMLNNLIPKYADFKHEHGFDPSEKCGKLAKIVETGENSVNNFSPVAVPLNSISIVETSPPSVSVTTESSKNRVNLPTEIIVTETEKIQTSIPLIKTCCGSYPNRFPYTTRGERGCCGQKTFNSLVFHCCEEDVISLSCA